MTLFAKNRFTMSAAAVAVVLFIFAALQQSGEHSERIGAAITTATSKVWPLGSGKSFYEIASKHGTDKVTSHSYQDMYEKYFPKLRNKRIKMLEIGLGCDMHYGPGKSYYTWLEYFPNVDLYYMEYDAACAAQWAHKTAAATVVAGDQGDPAVLEDFIATYGNDFDIIIDDGGHTMDQQKTSLQHLWKAVKPGGMYFCEDLQTSAVAQGYGGGPPGTKGTMMDMIHMMIEDMTYGIRQVDFEGVEDLVHVDCSREVCLFEKRL